ncbi:MAG: metallophosphoesterase [Patescibacteria group bacterium]
MKKDLFLLILLFLFPNILLAANISYSGCFELVRANNTATIRALSMNPSFTINNSASVNDVTYYITLENIDPDLMIPDFYDEDYGITRNINSMFFTVTVPAGESKQITVSPFFEEEDDYYFIALSDSQQIIATDELNPVFEDILEQIQTINPLFITHSGDVVKGGAELNTQLSDFKNAVDEVPTTFFTVPGNHDYSANFTDYEQYLGDQYYSFDYADTHFLAANTACVYADGQLIEPQFSWVNTNLASTTQDKKIVFWHHPLVPPVWSASLGFVGQANKQDTAQMLDNNNIELLTVGHTHGYDYNFLDSSDLAVILNGYYQLITGGAGGSTNEPDGRNHYQIMHVSDEGITNEVIYQNDFDISKNYINENDGTSEAVAMQLINESNIAIPYIRSKFKLSNTITRAFAKDELGNYLSLDYYNNGDYLVAYVETALDLDGYKTITVSKSNILHSGITNTVYLDGSIEYSETPLTDETEITHFTAIPSKRNTVIKNINWAVDGKSGTWKETAAKKDVNTTYNFTSLNANTVYTVKEGENFYKRFITDSTGSGSFTFTKNQKNRTFEFQSFYKTLSDQILTAPHSDGAGHIRRFDQTGDLKGQFYAYGAGVSGNFYPFWTDVNGDDINEILVSKGDSDKFSKIKLFSKKGKSKTSKKPFGTFYKDELNILVEDLDKNGRDEIIVAPKANNKYIKIYKNRKGKLNLLTKKKLSSNHAEIKISSGQINGKGNKEIIASYNNKLKIYKLTSKNKLKLLKQKTLNNNISKIHVGSLRGKAREEIIVATTNDKLTVYNFNKKNKLKKLTQKNISAEKILTGDVNTSGKFKEELIIKEGNNFKVYKYRNAKNKLKLIYSKNPYDANFDIEIYNMDTDKRAEIVVAPLNKAAKLKIYDFQGSLNLLSSFYPYDTTFTGGVNLAP